MSLHDRIMSMCAPDNVAQHPLCMGGFSVAQQEADQIAKAADELMAEMSEILDCCGMGMVCHNRARAMVNKYNAYKESTK